MVRKVDFYDRRLVDKVLLQHHRNAIIFQMMAIVTLIAFGNLMDFPAFRLPAASAFFLGFSVFIFLFSVLKIHTLSDDDPLSHQRFQSVFR